MPGQALKGYKRLHLPEFIGNRHMNVAKFSTLRNGRLYPQGDGTLIETTNKMQPCKTIYHSNVP